MIRNREVALLAVIALIAAYFMIWPVWRAWFPLEIGPTDGWNAYFQDIAFGPGLYPAANALVVNNYPPLSFYFIAALAKLFGDPLYVGRTVSILTTLGIGIEVGVVARQFGAGRLASVFAGLWVVAILARSFNSYVGRDDPQLLAQFIMMLGLIWFLRNRGRGFSATMPLLLMVVAGFFKHNVVAIPFTAVIWLFLHDGRKAIRPLMIAALVIAAGLMLCQLLYPTFFANMLSPRAYSIERVLIALSRLQWVAPALAIGMAGAWRKRNDISARFTMLFAGVALLSYLIQWTGDAVIDNAQFDLVIATAVGIGLAFNHAASLPLAPRIGATGVRTVIVAILAARLLATGRIEPALILFDSDYRAQFPKHAAIVQAEAARVARIPGTVFCENHIVCRMAGKSFEVDDYKTEQLVNTGTLTQAQLAALFQRRGVTVVPTDAATRAESLKRDVFEKPEPPVTARN
jgi:hypothetical protein